MCPPTFVPQFPHVAVQSRWEIPVSKSHKAPFNVSQWGQHRLPELSVRLCKSSAPKIGTSTNKIAIWGQSSMSGYWRYPWTTEQVQELLGQSRQSPGSHWEPWNELWKGSALRCTRPSLGSVPSTAQSPQALLQLLTLCSGERESWEPGESKHTLRSVRVQRTTVVHCPSQLQSSPLLPNLPVSSPSPLLRVWLNIELRVIPFMASQRYLLILPDGSHKAQKGKKCLSTANLDLNHVNYDFFSSHF